MRHPYSGGLSVVLRRWGRFIALLARCCTRLRSAGTMLSHSATCFSPIIRKQHWHGLPPAFRPTSSSSAKQQAHLAARSRIASAHRTPFHGLPTKPAHSINCPICGGAQTPPKPCRDFACRAETRQNPFLKKVLRFFERGEGAGSSH